MNRWLPVKLSLVMFLAGCEGAPYPKNEQAVAESGPPVEVSASDLSQAYSDNEVAAQAKYGNRVQKVSGIIDEITLDLYDEPVVVLKGHEMFVNVQAKFKGDISAEAAKLKRARKLRLLA